jgi:hypothetical protein
MATPNTKRDEKQSSNDLYTTPVQALDAIWPYMEDEVRGCRLILEPCAGMLDIVDYLESQVINAKVYTNELYPVDGVHYDDTGDFLAENNHTGKFDMIVTNPPYNKAVDFILKGFEHAPVQWHFLRLSFLEGQKRFEDLFNLGKLSDVYIFTYRVSCPKGVDREKTANSVCYAWYRFDKNYYGQPKLHWLTKGE